ncbi:ATP-binding protein [Promicromonospora sp. NPDC023987]|uniref:ATP-binding protein n=1 Tax=Promicromonospora sp. NPDC023987 TaxID=3155360 RepID=UPI0034069B77
MVISGDYLPRVMDAEVGEALGFAGAVLIEGPKYCGKTWTAMQFARTVVRVDDEEDLQLQAALDVDPGLLLKGEVPVLLDEWQYAPSLWNKVRREVDRRQADGQFILTGSSTPDDDARRHTGAGRYAVLQMRPMSLFESGHSTGQVSLRQMFDGKAPRGFAPSWDATSARRAIAERVVVGGWPANQKRSVVAAARANENYLSLIRQHDISRATGENLSPDVAEKVIRSLARGVATQMGEAAVARDARGGEPGHTLPPAEKGADATSRKAVAAHLDALRRLRIIEDQPAWGPSVRSARRLQSTPKRHLVDPSLAAAALGAGVERLTSDVLALGTLFESLAIRDLRVYSQPLRGRVTHYRDEKKLEVDAIVELPDGRWGAFEVKLGTTQKVVDGAAAQLRQMAALVDDNRCAFLAVLTNGGIATRRDDGVDLVPLTMLAP